MFGTSGLAFVIMPRPPVVVAVHALAQGLMGEEGTGGRGGTKREGGRNGRSPPLSAHNARVRARIHRKAKASLGKKHARVGRI